MPYDQDTYRKLEDKRHYATIGVTVSALHLLERLEKAGKSKLKDVLEFDIKRLREDFKRLDRTEQEIDGYWAALDKEEKAAKALQVVGTMGNGEKIVICDRNLINELAARVEEPQAERIA